ncbi:MAG TPA: glucose-1-phosphate adenylyltransferase [Erysipelothrix sp.]|jgi:glucose-1-phosphate adenylyltransferase|nr:glucose-1-phosphate adenylyltransferase [Erysipelothrix sp.]
MLQQEMVAMILAGGRGTRLHNLTEKVAKPAVSFGGKYRIVDFALSNCANSDVDVVGVLTQYESIFLNSYVALGGRWGLDARDSGVFVLPPREKEEGFGLYRGTADAIGQNIDFIDQQNPEYVLILSGDHIYKMDYSWMLAEHKKSKAEATIAVLEVPLKEASRFGIMNTDENDRIIEFEEKPPKPKSNLASMGIYIFNWQSLRKALIADERKEDSSHDFGKDIIPSFLNEGKKLQAYRFQGYWKDVGTIDSLWEANMDLLDPKSGINIRDEDWKIYTEDKTLPPHVITETGRIKSALVNQGSVVAGSVEHSVIFNGVEIEEGAVVKDSVILANVTIKKGAKINRCIIMEDLTIPEGDYGSPKSDNIELISEGGK